MVASDDDFIDDASDDEIQTRARGSGKSTSSRKTRAHRGDLDSNFELTRTWENVAEGEDGTIIAAVEGLADFEKRQR